ncbi:MAG: radical SAM protein, partial [Deltaproteobacteria bacterium]|nr:radical SAM protein [Deltaproteobacteria bacterium]
AIPLGLSRIKFSGGEPLLHPQFDKLLAIVKDKKLSWTMESNLTVLSDDILNIIANGVRPKHISTSIYSSIPEEHDKFTGVKGSFYRTIEGIRKLVKKDIHPQMIMSLHKDNVHQIESVVKLAEKEGCNSVKFNLIQPAGRSKSGNIPYLGGISPQEILEKGNWVDTNLTKKVKIPLLFDLPAAFKPIKKILSGSAGRCNIKNIIGILADGSYALCGIGYTVPDLIFGFISKDNLRDIWEEHPIIKDIRENLPEKLEGICRDCLFNYYCLGSCVAMNFHDTGSLFSSYRLCEILNKKGLFPETRKRGNSRRIK